MANNATGNSMLMIKIIPASNSEHAEVCATALLFDNANDMFSQAGEGWEQAYIPSTADDGASPDGDVITVAKGQAVLDSEVQVFYFHSARGGAPCIDLDTVNAYTIEGKDGLWAKFDDVVE